ncbi:MAG TPA: tetratricopeptide repeat protein [Anaerolineae bacterium]|nr:tetratricopeptide repeat protein [Anaerolineae bacterium]
MDFISQLLQRGIAAARAGQTAEARRLLTRVTELDENNVPAWLWLSGVVQTMRDRRLCLENVLTLDPTNAAAQAGLKWLNAQAAEVGEHCPGCGAVLPRSGKTCPACGLLLVIACPACGEYTDVSAQTCPVCNEPLGDFRTGAAYYLALAQAYLDHSRIFVAAEITPFVEAAAGDNADYLAAVAALYEALRNSTRAAAIYEQLIAKHPMDATAYLRLGALYQHEGLLDEARTIYQQALEKAAEHPDVLFALAQVYLAQDGASQMASRYLQRVAKLAPEHAPAHLALARLYHAQGKTPLATAHGERAVALTQPETQLGQAARQEIKRIQPTQSYSLQQGWGEVTRRIIGFFLPLGLSAWTNAQLSALKISFPAWWALLFGAVGAYLWTSAAELPQNPGMVALCGKEGLTQQGSKWAVGLVGAGLWLAAFAFILAKG